MFVNNEGQIDIQPLSQQKWLNLVEQIGLDDNTEDELAHQLAEQGIYVASPEEREFQESTVSEGHVALKSEKLPLDKILMGIFGVIILALVYFKIRKK
jgi:hypothetical protein